MGKYDDPTLYLPGGQGLIRFPDQDRWLMQGDRERAESYRGAALQLKAGLDRGNALDVTQCSATRRYDDGTVIQVDKRYNFYTMSIFCPPAGKEQQQEEAPVVPGLEKGQFYWVPGCVGRYDLKTFANSIPKEEYASKVKVGRSVRFRNPVKIGIPSPGSIPEVGITRAYNAASMPGDNLDSADTSSSGLRFDSMMLPTSGAWSMSCIFRINYPIEYDYTFSQLGVLNVIRPHVLFSRDGVNWRFDCPGSICPLMGYMRPALFSSGYVDMTYPWPPYNNDFSKTVRSYGYKEIMPSGDCPSTPLLGEDFSEDSPYWDNVYKDDWETHPYPLPHGVMIGINFMGMMLYNGNRILAGKIADFESEWELKPIITDEICLGSMHFACVSCDESGKTTLYINRLGSRDVSVYSSAQAKRQFQLLDESGSSLSVSAGGESFHSGDVNDSNSSDWFGSYRFSANMDIALPRFYHRELSTKEVELLLREAFGGVFVADDHEAEILIGMGLIPVFA